MSAVAEIERENILVQSMSGRRNKASKGGWNGGVAPYGYELQNGQLQIVEDEAAVIRDTFELYISTNKGATHVAKELNKRHTKKIKSRNDVSKFTTDFVKRIVDNPIYCGKIAYGRTVSEKIEGRRNEYHRIVQKDDSKIILSDGNHAPIVTEETWEMARQKRVDNAASPEKVNKDHHYILAGLVRCPSCGIRMYGRMNGNKKRKDGTLYPPSYSYVCRTHFSETSVDCPKPTSYAEKPLANAVRNIIVSLVHDDGFHDLVERSLGEKFDADVLTAEIETAERELRRLQRLQEQIENQLNTIDYESKNAAKLEKSYNNRLYKVIDDITDTEAKIEYLAEKLANAQTLEDTKAGIYDFLEHFEEIYDMMDDTDKRDFLKSFISSIEVFPKEGRGRGQWIKSIHFYFPMKMENGEMQSFISFEDEDDNGGDNGESGGNGGRNFPTLEDTSRAGGL
jgi:site-specific DNA recombinase